MALLTLFSCLILIQSIGCMENSTGYLLTLPKTLQAGAKERFCMIRHGIEEFTPYKLTLTHQDVQTFEEYTLWTDAGGCKEIDIPQKVGKYDVVLTDENSNEVLGEIEVEVQGQNLITLVQTDKPLYKPGEKVRFRILTMKRDLKPRIGKIAEVLIKDPNDIRVKQWLNVDSDGLTSLEFQLAPEPKLGDWAIEVKIDEDIRKQSFKVNEYVLPKFEVAIIPPSFVLVNVSEIKFKVCAKYTYGKPVKGFLSASVCLAGHRQSTLPCAKIEEQINGCQKFSVNSSEVFSGVGVYFYNRAKLSFDAEVREYDTGAVVKESHAGPSLSYDALKISLEDDTNKYFKPSFPYRGRAVCTKPDGSPAPGEKIEITMINYNNDIRMSKNFTSDKDGIVYFSSCESVAMNVTEFRIEARAVEYKTDNSGRPSFHRMYQPRDYATIKQWFSPSKTYIQIPQISKNVKCGDKITLDIPYTTTLDSYTLFNFQVMSRGRILHVGHKEHHFLKHDKTSMLDVPQVQCLIHEKETTPTPETQTTPPTPPPLPKVPETDSNTDTTKNEEGPKEEVVEEKIVPAVFQPLGFQPLPGERDIKKRSIMPHGPGEEIPVKMSDNPSTHTSHVKISFMVTPEMSPKSSLLVYFVRDDGETVADSIQFHVEPCFRNEVEMKFNEDQVLPGSETVLNIKAAPNSLCSIGVIDKSINILGGDHQLTPEKLLENIEKFSLSNFNYDYFSDQKYCSKKFENDEEMGEGPERWYHYSSTYVDAAQAFKSMGLAVMTNLALETRPCSKSFPLYYDIESGVRPLRFSSTRKSGKRKSTKSSSSNIVIGGQPLLRNYFPETWLWNLERIGDNGELIMFNTAPHTITKWLGNTICTSPNEGFGFSPVASLTTFQPFFLSFTLPYAAVRGERLPIRVTVFNYLQKCLMMVLNIDVGDDIELVYGSLKNEPFCVCGGKSYTNKYYIEAKDIGELPISAAVEIVPGSCENQVEMDLEHIGLKDAVERKILVKAEGITQEYSQSKYVCAKNDQEIKEDFNLTLPDNIVYDSARGHIAVIGDIMGPALSNLDKLVSQPTGCGEQTMVTFTPNIYVLKYLNSVNQNTEELETLCKQYMEIGYQRELTFRHDDGSFSAFGKSDAKGSTWLTAFVVQSFAQAKDYIYIDEKDLNKSIQFLRTTRLENGCFREVGKVFSSYMMGGLGKKSDIPDHTALTAYVIISLLEAKVPNNDTILKEAMECVNKQEDTDDVYTRAIVAYANVMFDPKSNQSAMAMRRLNELVIKEGSVEHWGSPKTNSKPVPSYYYKPRSADVEMSSYGMLARLMYSKDIADVVPIAMWLSEQRNSFGGYSSTQDTVVGLHALSEFASETNQHEPSDNSTTGLNILLEGDELETNVKVTPTNALLMQTIELTQLPNNIMLKTEGSGCALVQSTVRYNVLPEIQDTDGPKFSLKVTAARLENDCDLRNIKICVSFYKKDGYSDGMSLVTVGMVTSWSPDMLSLKRLRSKFPLLNMKKYEIDSKDGSVNFYFDELDNRGRCFDFDVRQNKDLMVRNSKPAIVKVFQYYESDVSATSSYNLKTICGTKAEIPIKPPIVPVPMDEIVQTRSRFSESMPSFIEQTREGARGPAVNTETAKCPICSNVIPDDLQLKICQSDSVYKVAAGRNGKVSMKIKSDLKPRKKVKINEFVQVSINDECKCDLLAPPQQRGRKRVKRILIFTKQSNLQDGENKERTLVLDGNSHLVNLDLNRKLERRIRFMSRKCGREP